MINGATRIYALVRLPYKTDERILQSRSQINHQQKSDVILIGHNWPFLPTLDKGSTKCENTSSVIDQYLHMHVFYP